MQLSKKPRLPKQQLTRLRVAIEAAKRLCDDSPTSTCGVAPNHKVAVRPFVSTYVLSDLEQMLEWAEGRV